MILAGDLLLMGWVLFGSEGSPVEGGVYSCWLLEGLLMLALVRSVVAAGGLFLQRWGILL